MPLNELAFIPIVEREVAFENRDPILKLYLARNCLRQIPGGVFQLRKLSVLSLRANKLEELAPAIVKLHNLEELNVSQNRLKYLPGEILSLTSIGGRLNKLHIFPNLFCQPKPTFLQEEVFSGSPKEAVSDLAEDIQVEEELRERLAVTCKSYHGYAARILARTPVHYIDSIGKSWSDFELFPLKNLPAELPTEPLNSDPAPPITNCRSWSRVPSLVELAIRGAYATEDFSTVSSVLGEDDRFPPYIRNVVAQAVKYKQEGDRHCVVCGRIMMVPRTSWLEWWELARVTYDSAAGNKLKTAIGDDADRFNSDENTEEEEEGIGEEGQKEDWKIEPISKKQDERAVPFLRQGCSWKCIPSKVNKREWCC